MSTAAQATSRAVEVPQARAYGHSHGHGHGHHGTTSVASSAATKGSTAASASGSAAAGTAAATTLRRSTENVARVVADVLQQLSSGNDELPYTATPFHSTSVPNISLRDYVHRLAVYGRCQSHVFISALVYIDRIISNDPKFLVNSKAIHRLLLSCCVLAVKFWEDTFYPNSYYAKVGGVTVDEMNRLEVHALVALKFRLVISHDLYQTYHQSLPMNSCAVAIASPAVAQAMPGSPRSERSRRRSNSFDDPQTAVPR